MMPLRHVLPGTVALLVAYLLLLLVNVGLFDIQARFDWQGISTLDSAKSFFSWHINQDVLLSSPLVEAKLGIQFWLLQAILFSVAMVLPLLRLPYALSIVALTALAFAVIFTLHPLKMSAVAWSNLTVISLVYCLVFLISEARERKLISSLFSRFVPPTLVHRFNQDQRAFYLDTEPRQLTVMFCDIHNFTTISERMSPSLLAKWLGEYFEMATTIIERNQGTIDKYMGDSVMAIWGAPEVNSRHADRAIDAAHQIVDELVYLNRRLEVQGLPPISVGIGLASGVCNVGIMGSVKRRSYTVVGDVVNTAQRLEKLTRQYEASILYNDRTANLARSWRSQELGSEYVKGRKRFVTVFRALGKVSVPALGGRYAN